MKKKNPPRRPKPEAKRLLGFERVEHVARSSYKDTSTIVIVPSRSPEPTKDGDQTWPWLRHEFVAALSSIMWPMNGKRHMMFVTGAEVGAAYDDAVAAVLAHPELSKWKYIASIEDDNPPPPDAFLKLYESIDVGPFDAVGGLYFTRGDVNMPMCYGSAEEFARTGVLDFKPLSIASAIQKGEIVECNGIANGCSLYRMDMFRDIPRPWFKTLNEPGQGAATQDLFFCSKARRAGKRVAVDMRVRVPHVDWINNVWY